jgi:hypothetical protein
MQAVQFDSSQYVIYSHKTSPLNFYPVMRSWLMIYGAESVDFYRQAESLNQSINIGYIGLSLKLNVKRGVPIDAY